MEVIQLWRTWTEITNLFLQKTKRRKETKYGSSCLPEYVAVGKLPGKRFVVTSSSVLAFDCLIKYILIDCRLIVAMPSGKRQTERKGNAPVNTGPSPNSDGCTNNTVEEAEEHFLKLLKFLDENLMIWNEEE
ncbi:hypothetical protein T05_3638 [Trichinella murrelli]|uniref:Uncharacterized protein n=1 Tax=Trichinella murrelli TaxID=144512 RepID=A0A0V0TDF9_9BILA|nr:hypothetical protein T05_3638 [Trichinella murrelli]